MIHARLQRIVSHPLTFITSAGAGYAFIVSSAHEGCEWYIAAGLMCLALSAYSALGWVPRAPLARDEHTHLGQ